MSAFLGSHSIKLSRATSAIYTLRTICKRSRSHQEAGLLALQLDGCGIFFVVGFILCLSHNRFGTGPMPG